MDLDWFQCREMAKKCMCGFEYHLKSMRPNCRMSMYMQVLALVRVCRFGRWG